MLALDQVSKQYGDHLALDRLSLEVCSGEVVCLLGANGAGKTTVIHSLLGFVRPSSGTARVGGLDAQQQPNKVRRMLAFVPEVVVLYDHLDAVENLEFLCALAESRPSREQLEYHLLTAGLARDAIHRRVGTYSKGMRQKVGIALALARNVKAMVLDEPLSGLDPGAAYEISGIVRQRAREGSAILITTHDLYRAKDMATRVGILRAGRLVDLLTAEQVSYSDLEEIYLEHMRQ